MERLGGVIAIVLLVICMTFLGVGIIGLVRDMAAREDTARVNFLEGRVRALEEKNRLLETRVEQAALLEPAAVRLVELVFRWVGAKDRMAPR